MVETRQEISPTDLARRVLTFSSSSLQVLGDKTDPMLRDIEARLAPHVHDGLISEIVVSAAQVVRR